VNLAPDPYYAPIIFLPEVKVPTGEDDEEEMFKIRSRLYRYAHECDPPEWKERGTGDIRILKHKGDNTCRIVMRREKTMKLCLNHKVQPWMQLKKNVGSEKAWVWKTQADFADGESKHETLAARFSTVENAKKWETAFEKARVFVVEKEAEQIWKEEREANKDKTEITTKEEHENKENIDSNKEVKAVDSSGDTAALKQESPNQTEVTDKMAELVVNQSN